jgi:1,2-phenylacetyl-CoA epoxidase catalytic subunit
MSRVETTTLPRKYHQAVERWRDLYLPDYWMLLDRWEKFFPRDPRFELCAYRQCGMCAVIECGDEKGQPKRVSAADLHPEQAQHLLGAIKAQASTEFGSIQQHQLTLSRAAEEEDQFWILRMMAEELRHGYQMLSLLVGDDWSKAGGASGDQMAEEILNMRTGSHVLGAFNVDFDSFVDNIVFCALIDRVGKYQLAMQSVSAYRPMAESMPPMLREEAFHLATGVVPLRRWVTRAAQGDPTVTMADVQLALNKWLPRGLEMFGDERGGDTNVRFGLKPMKNAEAADQYFAEVQKVADDLNLRWLRARKPTLGADAADAAYRSLVAGSSAEGIQPEEILRLPDRSFFRRRGVHAFAMADVDGSPVADLDAYKQVLARRLPAATRAGRDFRWYWETLGEVVAGTLTPDAAAKRMPALRRVGGVCPCSRAVRWVVDDDAPSRG